MTDDHPGDAHDSSSEKAQSSSTDDSSFPSEDSTLSVVYGDAARDKVGSYRLLRILGEGGMGIVYLAEQTRPVQRRVALKLIKLGMDTREFLSRFDAERQALALMSHPAIARVFEAGATEEGRPFFAMEYVDGLPIDRYCDQHGLSVQRRLGLFSSICMGVQHAHQKGIIHRDLKPSNILIASVDGEPVPKVIDFGLAKALAHRMGHQTTFTQFGQLLGTPAYMSPEQAGVGTPDIDTRSDIYSLGVLLYQLLAGRPPFDMEELRGVSWDEICRRIREDEPPSPSSQVNAAKAELRSTDARNLTRELRGDLDRIVMKALEKDRERRYRSPADLAADIQRYLRHEPVAAASPSLLYRLGKLARRNKTAVITSSLVLAALAAGTVGTSLALLRALDAELDARNAQGIAEAEAGRAGEEAQVSAQVVAFLEELFEIADPGEARGNEIRVREVLDRGADRIRRRLTDRPIIQARIMTTIGRVYAGLGLYEPANDLLTQALDVRKRELGLIHPKVASSLHDLCALFVLQADHATARPLCEQAVSMRGELLGPEHPDFGRSLGYLAWLHHGTGDLDSARSLYERALSIQRAALGPSHPDIAFLTNGLGHVSLLLGDPDKARGCYERALEINRVALGEDHPRVAWSLMSLGELEHSTGNPDVAAAFLEEALTLQERTLGPDHWILAGTLHNLARVRLAQGDRVTFEELWLRGEESESRIRGPSDPWRLYNKACYHSLRNERGLALDYLRQALEMGFTFHEHARRDTDLRLLQDDPEFAVLLQAMESRSIGAVPDARQIEDGAVPPD